VTAAGTGLPEDIGKDGEHGGLGFTAGSGGLSLRLAQHVSLPAPFRFVPPFG